jgi:hypothetical protein
MWVFATAVFLVLFFLFYKHPLIMLNASGIIIAATASIGYAIYWYNESISKPYIDPDTQVSVSVIYSTTSCNDAFPLAVTIGNGSDKTVERVDWQMGAFATGRSTNLAKYQLEPFVSDGILAPGAVVTLCYALPGLNESQQPSTLLWNAYLRHVSYRY